MLTNSTSTTTALAFSLSMLLACGSAGVDGQTTSPTASSRTASDTSQVTAAAETKGDVPAVVASAFAIKYPRVDVQSWSRDRNDNYEALFEQAGEKLRADFSPTGVWIETERSLKWKDLPAAVQAAIESEYNKEDIVELEFTQNAERGEFYDIEIDPKGDKKFDVELRSDGSKI